METSNIIKCTRGLLYFILALFLVGSIINCGGGGSSSGPVQVQVPKSLIQDFIAKHETMVDKSIVDFYVVDERPMVAAAVEKTIDEKKESGELDRLQKTAFDFSNLKIEVVGEKEVTYRDVPTKAIKVSVAGSYEMKQGDTAKTVQADKTIILEMVDNGWKVTEQNDPFKEYHFKTRG